MMQDYQPVCSLDDVPVGQSRMFDVDGQLIAVFNVDGDYFAIDNHCPHAGASLAHGSTEGDIVSCRIHHWRFCVRNGRYVDEDRPEYNARTFDVKVIDDMISVDVNSGSKSGLR